MIMSYADDGLTHTCKGLAQCRKTGTRRKPLGSNGRSKLGKVVGS